MRAIKFFILSLLIFLSFILGANTTAQAQPRGSAQAQSNSATCYLHEEDPATKKRYASREAHAADLERWKHVPHSMVGPIDLLIAYKTYRAEKPYAETLKTDKAMHCYIGCMIGLATSAKVTDFVGWLKEYEDLTDCDPTTHFEDADSIATSRGARLGARDQTECSDLCIAEFHPAHAPTSR